MKRCNNCLHFKSPEYSPFVFCGCIKRVPENEFDKHLKEKDVEVTCKYWRNNQ